MTITPWTDEERAAYLDCPKCGEPAIPSSGTRFVCLGLAEPTWTEDDEADCARCGAKLVAFLTGDEDGEWMEAREREEEDGA